MGKQRARGPRRRHRVGGDDLLEGSASERQAGLKRINLQVFNRPGYYPTLLEDLEEVFAYKRKHGGLPKLEVLRRLLASEIARRKAERWGPFGGRQTPAVPSPEL